MAENKPNPGRPDSTEAPRLVVEQPTKAADKTPEAPEPRLSQVDLQTRAAAVRAESAGASDETAGAKLAPPGVQPTVNPAEHTNDGADRLTKEEAKNPPLGQSSPTAGDPDARPKSEGSVAAPSKLITPPINNFAVNAPLAGDELAEEQGQGTSEDERSRRASARARLSRMQRMRFPNVVLVSVKNNPGVEHFDVIVGDSEPNPVDDAAPHVVTHGQHYHFVTGQPTPVIPEDVEFLLNYPSAKFVLADGEK